MESMDSLAFSSKPGNWPGPGWIVVNYFAWKALPRYGFKQVTAALAVKAIE